MKRITIVFFMLFAFALFFSNVKAQPTIDYINHSNLPFTLDQPIQFVEIDVNNDEESEFAITFELNPSPSPDVTDYLTAIMSRHESGLLIEPEHFTLPPTFSPLPEIDGYPPLTDAPVSTIYYPYISLFPQGVRVENKSPNHESMWGSGGMLAGDIFTLSVGDNQVPLESSYIDGLLSGYIGARYTKNGKTFYGWIEVSVDDSEPSITIESMLFQEIPDRRSYTGLMSVVPVALVSSLLGFFAIGIGVYFRRRKK
jgi:hypothetical protein